MAKIALRQGIFCGFIANAVQQRGQPLPGIGLCGTARQGSERCSYKREKHQRCKHRLSAARGKAHKQQNCACHVQCQPHSSLQITAHDKKKDTQRAANMRNAAPSPHGCRRQTAEQNRHQCCRQTIHICGGIGKKIISVFFGQQCANAVGNGGKPLRECSLPHKAEQHARCAKCEQRNSLPLPPPGKTDGKHHCAQPQNHPKFVDGADALHHAPKSKKDRNRCNEERKPFPQWLLCTVIPFRQMQRLIVQFQRMLNSSSEFAVPAPPFPG